MIHRDKNQQQGFTLVELMLALAFVAFILIFALTTVIQVMQTYNKGLALKKINQAGRTTLNDISRNLKVADPSAVDVSAISDGRVCFGSISYVWNSYDTSTSNANKFDDNSSLVLARVNDPAEAMCSQSNSVYPDVPKDDATEILVSTVWIMTLSIGDPSVDSPLVNIRIQLAIADDPAIVSGKCSYGGSVGQYCATSDFSTTVIVGGGEE